MKDDKRLRRKVRNSYMVSTVSIALVLFLLGSVGYLMTTALRAASSLREGVSMSVELRDGLDSVRLAAVEKQLAASEMVRSVRFSSKREKIDDEEFRKMFAGQIEEILGENPLFDSFEVQLSARSAEKELLAAFVERTERIRGVAAVSYPVLTVERLHATIGKIELVLLLFGGALLVISLILLSNTIRLAIYSKRYLINTLKLVGATKWFIMRPFLGSALAQGLLAGLVASVLFCAAVYGLNEAVPELSSADDVQRMAVIAGSMVAGGLFISLLFTAAAVNKFVNMKSNKIYLY